MAGKRKAEGKRTVKSLPAKNLKAGKAEVVKGGSSTKGNTARGNPGPWQLPG